jgi:hypothetical protein
VLDSAGMATPATSSPATNATMLFIAPRLSDRAVVSGFGLRRRENPSDCRCPGNYDHALDAPEPTECRPLIDSTPPEIQPSTVVIAAGKGDQRLCPTTRATSTRRQRSRE